MTCSSCITIYSQAGIGREWYPLMLKINTLAGHVESFENKSLVCEGIADDTLAFCELGFHFQLAEINNKVDK